MYYCCPCFKKTSQTSTSQKSQEWKIRRLILNTKNVSSYLGQFLWIIVKHWRSTLLFSLWSCTILGPCHLECLCTIYKSPSIIRILFSSHDSSDFTLRALSFTLLLQPIQKRLLLPYFKAHQCGNFSYWKARPKGCKA